ncbi:PadR family transcriptional regulator [uncultured Sphingomonas sp.]|uniref:PadR family transcriptional regulator n=1 Tax=uncultured Sphingomonas sp. TaxID=158754 RepID=UPI0025EE88FD|nr:PadR family transcriptional regulator [uncultured Sphingomonas sp.]
MFGQEYQRRGAASRGGWEQWSQRLERRFAEKFGDGRGCAPRGGWDRWNERMEERFAEKFGGRGGGGRRRMFDGSELRLVLLKLISETPRHGYDLIREIEARTSGAYMPSAGVVYPTITLLADMDLIAEQPGEGAKKVFAITPAGEAHLAERSEDVAELMNRLTALGRRTERSNRGPVQRAIGNLRQVIHQKLHDDGVDQDKLHAIADILDDAARRIERL